MSGPCRPTTVGELVPNPENPRTITPEQLERLGRSMHELGDLSGIVVNRRTGVIVGGHQRHKHMPPETPITYTRELEEPDWQGTVAEGYIILEGTRWTYRLVDWDEQRAAEAMLGANQHGGDWDAEKLESMLREFPNIEAAERAGFSEAQLAGMVSPVVFDTLRQEGEAGPARENSNLDQIHDHTGKWMLFRWGDIQVVLWLGLYERFLEQFERSPGTTEQERLMRVLSEGLGELPPMPAFED